MQQSILHTFFPDDVFIQLYNLNSEHILTLPNWYCLQLVSLDEAGYSSYVEMFKVMCNVLKVFYVKLMIEI